MGENSHIAWTDHTFNPWIGCSKVSPGCTNCYAETWSARYGRAVWGPGQARQRTSAANWRQPLKWDREAARTGTKLSVFCASLSDWLDPEVPVEWLVDLLALIVATPNLRWLLLTKRPELWGARVEEARNSGRSSVDNMNVCWDWLNGTPPPNVWIGATVEDQRRADERIPHLLAIPAAVRFLSCEPLLEPVDLLYSAFNGSDSFGSMPGIDWVIAGCESGPGRRACEPEWLRGLRDQCAAADVPFFLKQMEIGGKVVKDCPPLDGKVWDEVPL